VGTPGRALARKEQLVRFLFSIFFGGRKGLSRGGEIKMIHRARCKGAGGKKRETGLGGAGQPPSKESGQKKTIRPQARYPKNIGGGATFRSEKKKKKRNPVYGSL